MKPKGNRNRSSTSFSPPQRDRISKRDPNPRRSVATLNLDENQRNADEILFETLMSDPVKKALVLQMLSKEKGNIERYKRNEEKKNANLDKASYKRFRNNQRLLHCESPTALLRRRALQKNRCESESSSSTTSDSKSVTPSPVPFNRLLDGVVAYVEIRSKEGDRSAGAKALMQSMGAIVLDHFSREVTHVLFKDGSFSTYQKAKLMKVHLVSVLWLEAVRKNNVRVPEKNYPALGTEAYEVNISAICQDYEKVVRDEYQRSLSMGASISALPSKGRKTALPSELPQNVNTSSTSSGSFHTPEKLPEIVPSSQDWEAESVISYESGYPPFRRAIPTVLEEGSDRLLTPTPELTSDGDSDCGVINGHSVRHIRDSLLGDLVNESNEERSNEPEKGGEEPSNIKDRSANTSSSRSLSLLARKSVVNRKSSYSIVDMDLTSGTEHSDKENLKSKSKKPPSSAKKTKRAMSSGDSNVIDEINKTNSVETRSRLSKRKTIGSVQDLKVIAPDNSKVTATDDTSVNHIDCISLHTTGSSTRSLSGLINFKKPADVSNGRTKSSCNSDDIPCVISIDSTNDKEQNCSTEHANCPRRSSRRVSAASNTSVNSKKMSTGNCSSDGVERPKTRRSKYSDTESETNHNRNSLDSEKMSPLRISTDTEKSLGKNSGPSNKRVSTSSETADVSKSTKRNSSDSEVIPSLRISDGSNVPAKQPRASSERSSSGFKSAKLQKGPSPKATRKSARISNENLHEKDSSSSEVLPTLRISNESSAENAKNADAVHISEPTSSSRTTLAHRIDRSSEADVLELSNLQSTSVTSDKSPSRSIVDEVTVSNDINDVERRTNDKDGVDCDIPYKRKKLEDAQQKGATGEPPEGKNKRLRKLYNPNQSISNTMKNWEVNNTDTENRDNPTSPENNPVIKKALVIPLTPILLTQNARKFLKSQINKSPSKKEFKAKKQQVVSKKTKKPVKPSQKIYVDEDKDEQKELTEEYVTRDEPMPNTTSKRKLNTKEDSQSPKLQAISGRRSQRLSQCQKPSYKEQSSSNDSNDKMHIVPDQSRRSTLEFVQKSSTKSRKKLTQKAKKIKSSVVCTRMHKPEVQTFMQIVKKLGAFFIEDEVSEKTTHLVVGESKRTINLLRAIARGCWIITKEWLFRSLEAGKWLPEEDFELTEFSSSVQQCRVQRQAFGKLYSMDIFANCGPIYIARGSIPRCSDLEELVELCKGTVVKSISRASIVVGEWVRYDYVTCVTEKWILDSITLNHRKYFKNYLIKHKG